MTRLTVSVEQDHLERLVKAPVYGLAELVWNALDADATRVSVDVTVNALAGPEHLEVSDNGTGITPERAQLDFGHLGGSWKKSSTLTEGGRQLHGRNGQGRWAAYGLGEKVQWLTVADGVAGRQRSSITGRRSSLREFNIDDPVSAEGQSTGTTVHIENLNEVAQKALADESTVQELTAIFALYIKQYDVEIVWQGDALDPTSLQESVYQKELVVEGAEDVSLTVIEWRQINIKRALHLCDKAGASLHQMPPGVHAPGFEFTAYVTWDGFREHAAELSLADFGIDPLASVIDAAKEEIRSLFKRRSSERGSRLIRSWKDDLTYPYKGEPTSVVERAERDLFDIVAVAAASAVESADLKSRKLSLRLLKEAIERSPGTVHEVIQEVIDLPAERLQELRDLIEKTSLSSIISAARQVTDRLDFLVGLEEIVFDQDLKKRVLERSQLHRILASETWVFREEYALTADDVTLRTALRDHIGLLGREGLAPEDVEAEEVLDDKGRRVVVDMMLSRVIEQRRNHREHIVIELKRPNVHVGMTQFSQIQNYASAVTEDPRFAQTDCRWEFWIIGDKLETPVAKMANQKGRDQGIVVDGENFVVRAVTWAEIIQNARHRLGFVRNALDYQSGNDEAFEYLRRKHGDYLPGLLAGE